MCCASLSPKYLFLVGGGPLIHLRSPHLHQADLCQEMSALGTAVTVRDGGPCASFPEDVLTSAR